MSTFTAKMNRSRIDVNKLSLRKNVQKKYVLNEVEIFLIYSWVSFVKFSQTFSKMFVLVNTLVSEARLLSCQ